MRRLWPSVLSAPFSDGTARVLGRFIQQERAALGGVPAIDDLRHDASDLENERATTACGTAGDVDGAQ
jgi:hypothetical protein